MDALSGLAKSVMVSFGFRDKETANYQVKDGRVRADIDYSNVKPDQRAKVEAQGEELAQGLFNLDEKIKEARASGNHEEARQLVQKRSDLQNAFTEFKYQVETPEASGLELGLMIVGGVATYGAATPIIDGLMDTHANDEKIQVAYKAATSMDGYSPQINNAAPSPPPPREKDYNIGSGGGQDMAKAVGHDQKAIDRVLKGSDKDVANAILGEKNGLGNISDDQLLALMKNDPGKFARVMKEVNDKNPQIGSMVMTRITDHVQSMNRFWSMISNVMNADHETRKAQISNLRV